MQIRFFCPLLLALFATSLAHAQEPMQIGFLWHMHQPIYYPGETILQTEAAGHFSFSLNDVHNSRFGPYTSWPKDAITAISAIIPGIIMGALVIPALGAAEQPAVAIQADYAL